MDKLNICKPILNIKIFNKTITLKFPNKYLDHISCIFFVHFQIPPKNQSR